MRELKQPRAKVTREKVVGEARRLYALKGYHDTRLEEILHAAGVTTGAFFHHFKSKEDLAFAVIDRHIERRRELLDRIELTVGVDLLVFVSLACAQASAGVRVYPVNQPKKEQEACAI